MPLHENTTKPSTRHHVVDARFAAILAHDFAALPANVILNALDGEPQKQAIAICSWTSRTDDPARALTSWAKKNGRGRHRRCGEAAPRPRDNRRHSGRGRDIPARRQVTRSPKTAWGLDAAEILAALERMA